MSTFILDEGNTITVTAAGADRNGKPAPLDPATPLTWTGDNSFASIVPTVGKNECNFIYASPGLLTVTCTGKAADGTTVISGTFTLQCNAAMATHITFTASPEFLTPVTTP